MTPGVYTFPYVPGPNDVVPVPPYPVAEVGGHFTLTWYDAKGKFQSLHLPIQTDIGFAHLPLSRNRTPRIAIVVVLAAALSLLLAVGAFAAHPNAGKRYSGFVAGNSWNSFEAPVSFKVSSDGKRLLVFTWAGFGCFGEGGPAGINPLLDRYNIVKVGTIKVLSSGKFSVKNVKWTAYGTGPMQPTKVTFSTISGRFTTARRPQGRSCSRRRCKEDRPAAVRSTVTCR